MIDQENRASLLAGLACVDVVVIFDEPTPEELIRQLEPDVLVKGGDYTPDQIAGADFVLSRGGRVVTHPPGAGAEHDRDPRAEGTPEESQGASGLGARSTLSGANGALRVPDLRTTFDIARREQKGAEVG